MRPNHENLGAEEDGKKGNLGAERGDVPEVTVPPLPVFPPPPTVNYERPVLKKGEYAAPPDLHVGVDNRQDKINQAARIGSGLSAGITLASSVVVSVLIGMWIDKRFEPNSTPWATIVFALLGFIAGFISFMRISQVTDRNINRRK